AGDARGVSRTGPRGVPLLSRGAHRRGNRLSPLQHAATVRPGPFGLPPAPQQDQPMMLFSESLTPNSPNGARFDRRLALGWRSANAAKAPTGRDSLDWTRGFQRWNLPPLGLLVSLRAGEPPEGGTTNGSGTTSIRGGRR